MHRFGPNSKGTCPKPVLKMGPENLTKSLFRGSNENHNPQKMDGKKALEVLSERCAHLEVRTFQELSKGCKEKIQKLSDFTGVLLPLNFSPNENESAKSFLQVLEQMKD